MWVSFCVFFLIASTLETHGICTAWKSESYCALVTYLIRLDNGLHWCLGLPRKPISLSSDWLSATSYFVAVVELFTSLALVFCCTTESENESWIISVVSWLWLVARPPHQETHSPSSTGEREKIEKQPAGQNKDRETTHHLMSKAKQTQCGDN